MIKGFLIGNTDKIKGKFIKFGILKAIKKALFKKNNKNFLIETV